MPGSSKRAKEYDAVLIVRVEKGLRERVARAAYLQGMSLSDATRDALEQWLMGLVPDEPREVGGG